MLAAGTLVRVTPGWYWTGPASRLGPEERYRLRVVATARHPAFGGVISHDSAAAVHGLGLLNPDRRRVHSTAPHRGTRGAGRIVHPGSAEPVIVDGVPVTTMARTAVDVARRGSAVEAFVAVDSALRARTRRAEMAGAVDALGRARGVPRARWAVGVATGLAESVGESFSLARMVLRPGFPLPRQQHELLDDAGRFVARTDFDWLGGRIVGEFDGRVKFGADIDPAGRALWKEKLREDRIRATGAVVARWTWPDLEHPERLWAVLHRAFDAAGARTPWL